MPITMPTSELIGLGLINTLIGLLKGTLKGTVGTGTTPDHSGFGSSLG